MMNKFSTFRGTYCSLLIRSSRVLFKRNYTKDISHENYAKETIHPYKRIHPWKSRHEFTEFLLKNLLYNKDDLVVLNKPYGIPIKRQSIERKDMWLQTHKIPNEAPYTIDESLPDIAYQLGYEKLSVVKSLERYASGAVLLAGTQDKVKAVLTASRTAMLFHENIRTFWCVTTRVPHELKGEKRLALKLLVRDKTEQKRPVIVKEWSKNAAKRREVIPFNVKFKVLSNSTLNLASLLELELTLTKWHAIRMFTTTQLHSPILGDNILSTRIQNIMGTYLEVNPFHHVIGIPPKLDSELYKLLKVTRQNQEIIPVHLHVRSLQLPLTLGNSKPFKVVAPLLPPFDWTCKQLKFKYPIEEENQEAQNDLKAAL